MEVDYDNDTEDKKLFTNCSKDKHCVFPNTFV